MRRVLGMTAALVLAACSVEVEGARCSQPGANAECPDGQACGNDGRCSERAAACASRCEPGASRCTGSPGTSTDAVETCTDDDPVCGAWTLEACGTLGLRCVERGEAHACECPPNDTAELSADPAGGSALGSPWYPTGAAGPPQCRFRRLGDALAAAVAHGGPTTVQVRSEGVGTPVVFGESTGETFPLEVPEQVTLLGTSAPAGETSLEADGVLTPTLLRAAGTVERLRVANVSLTGNGGTGVELSCGVSGQPTLRDVTVSAAARKLASGVTVTNACGALLERVDVSGAFGAALEIAVPASVPVTARGSLFHGSGAGVRAKGGILRFEGDGSIRTEVTDNVGNGIELSDSTSMDARLADVLVARNGGTGIFINMIPTGSAFAMTSCEVHSNGTVSPLQYGSVGNERTAGGILVRQSDLATFSMAGNRIYANHGGTGADGLAFYSSRLLWPVNTGSCDTANAFGCPGTGQPLNATTPGTVDARFSRWNEIPPPVNSGVLWDPNCVGPVPACP